MAGAEQPPSSYLLETLEMAIAELGGKMPDPPHPPINRTSALRRVEHVAARVRGTVTGDALWPAQRDAACRSIVLEPTDDRDEPVLAAVEVWPLFTATMSARGLVTAWGGRGELDGHQVDLTADDGWQWSPGAAVTMICDRLGAAVDRHPSTLRPAGVLMFDAAPNVDPRDDDGPAHPDPGHDWKLTRHPSAPPESMACTRCGIHETSAGVSEPCSGVLPLDVSIERASGSSFMAARVSCPCGWTDEQSTSSPRTPTAADVRLALSGRVGVHVRNVHHGQPYLVRWPKGGT